LLSFEKLLEVQGYSTEVNIEVAVSEELGGAEREIKTSEIDQNIGGGNDEDDEQNTPPSLIKDIKPDFFKDLDLEELPDMFNGEGNREQLMSSEKAQKEKREIDESIFVNPEEMYLTNESAILENSVNNEKKRVFTSTDKSDFSISAPFVNNKKGIIFVIFGGTSWIPSIPPDTTTTTTSTSISTSSPAWTALIVLVSLGIIGFRKQRLKA
jgi:hypothetical protein